LLSDFKPPGVIFQIWPICSNALGSPAGSERLAVDPAVVLDRAAPTTTTLHVTGQKHRKQLAFSVHHVTPLYPQSMFL